MTRYNEIKILLANVVHCGYHLPSWISTLPVFHLTRSIWDFIQKLHDILES